MGKNGVRASWVDGTAFKELWRPLEDANEFLLASCYVSQQGWEELQELLVQHLSRDAFHARLIFSISGISEKTAMYVVNRLYELVTDRRWFGRVAAYLIRDRSAGLFHPKAHGSRSGSKTKLVIGSGNLTAGGMGANLELMSVIEDDLDAYDQFRRALLQLDQTKVLQINSDSIGAIRSHLSATELTTGSATQKKKPNRGNPNESAERTALPSRAYAILLPTNPDYLEALASVRRLVEQGGFLARIDQLDPLNISVPLTSFRDAGLLEVNKAEELVTGLSYEEGGGSITLSLVPSALREQLKSLTGPLGKLVGRYSIETLGGRWMPLDWHSQFKSVWDDLVSGQDLVGFEPAVEKHVSGIARNLKSGKLKRQLAERLEVSRPANWKEARARKLLGWSEERSWPVKLTDNLRSEVADVVIRHVEDSVRRRLTSEFPIAQLQQVGRGPFLRSVSAETIDIVDAMLFLADWSIAGVMPRLRSATGDLSRAPGRSCVVECIARAFDRSKFEPDAVYETAVRWQDGAGARTELELQAALAEAWKQFVNWFGLVPTTTGWSERLPKRSTPAEEDQQPS